MDTTALNPALLGEVGVGANAPALNAGIAPIVRDAIAILPDVFIAHATLTHLIGARMRVYQPSAR